MVYAVLCHVVLMSHRGNEIIMVSMITEWTEHFGIYVHENI